MLSNNGLCLRAAAQYVLLSFSNSSIIPTGFKFTELHTLTLAACSYALLMLGQYRFVFSLISLGVGSPSADYPQKNRAMF